MRRKKEISSVRSHMYITTRGLPLITYAYRGGGVKPPIHFHCVLHAKRWEGVQIACKIAYILNGRPQPITNYLFGTISIFV